MIKPVDVNPASMQPMNTVFKLLPKWSDIPDEFTNMNSRNKFIHVINQWFFNGLPENTVFIPKRGIEINKALRHVSAIMNSWEPKHEHKTAGCAYLLSLWFDDIVLEEK